MRRFSLLIAVSLLSFVCASRASVPQPLAGGALQPTVILISLDGWRWDYFGLAPTPNMDKLAARGVRAERLIPVFPTKTFPNHYSMVTGLYPSKHGIISNNIYDPTMNARFSLSDRDAVADARWWGGEPIWVLSERRGRPTGTLFWPGSEAAILGIRPRYWKTYDAKMSHVQRVDQIVAWLELPEAERPRFLTLYFSDTDDAGHRQGPKSQAVAEAMSRLDAAIGRLMSGLAVRGIDDDVNVIIVSDHGMAEISPERRIYLDDYLDLGKVEVIDWSPVLGLRPLQIDTDAAYRGLKDAHPRLRVYRRQEMPERLHFRDNPRIPPIIGMADEGWSITRRGAIPVGSLLNRGEHGYDNEAQTMHGIFIAAGPAFRKSVVVRPFENVHVYALITNILGLPPADTDADLDVVQPMLEKALAAPSTR